MAALLGRPIRAALRDAYGEEGRSRRATLETVSGGRQPTGAVAGALPACDSVTHKPDVPLGDVEQFLVSRHGRPIESLAPLPGGFWSAAYAYRVGDQDLVLRLGTPASPNQDKPGPTPSWSAPQPPRTPVPQNAGLES